jgi:PAB-dependent poly(A)-specific ribonuclease subunit 2
VRGDGGEIRRCPDNCGKEVPLDFLTGSCEMNVNYYSGPQYSSYQAVGDQGAKRAFEIAEIAEIAVTQINSSNIHLDCINSLRFDSAEETLWAGTYYGSLHQFLNPGLETYARLQAHTDGIISLRSNGHSCISVTPNQLSVHLSGCIPHILYNDKTGDLSAIEFDVSRNHRILLGRSQGGITSFDVFKGQLGGTIDTGGVGVIALCGPVASGGLVLATADGRISLLDARDGLKQQGSALPAHTGGFAAIDAAGYLVATAGFAARMGRLTLESTVKVFDCRMGLRMFNNIPFPAGPSLLRFDPVRMNTLLTASADGVLQYSDATGVSIAGTVSCVNSLLEGTTLISCDVSPSGECLAFGTSAGCVHLFSTVSDRVSPCFVDERGVFPPMPGDGALVDRFPVYGLGEDDPISLVPAFLPPHSSHHTSVHGVLASDIGSREEMSVGLGPRTISKSIMSGGKLADFVFYVDNPKYVRGETPGTAAAAASVLRNTRVQFQLKSIKADARAKRAERAAARTAAGLSNIPDRYHQVMVQQQKGSRFEEFDFSRYNTTRFSGLENGLANCYVNSLLQVLFFCRPMYDLMMQHVPDPNLEFALLDEMSLLFRMLATARGQVCQAANLLRALRQSKEALALGLLEGVRGERGAADIEVEAHKDKSLTRRTQRLCRFLLETMNKEASSRINTTSIASSRTEIELIFALFQIQRLKCLSHPDLPVQQKIARLFQVDLKYPNISSSAEAGTGGKQQKKQNKQCIQDKRPSFGDVLAQSLLTSTEFRAWFNADLGYQMVRQDRIPCEMPNILVVACGLESEDDLVWWQPIKDCEESHDGVGRPWLPLSFSLRIDTENADIEVYEVGKGETEEPTLQATYSLTAVVAHVREEVYGDDTKGKGEVQEGHLVAHIKIPRAYYLPHSNMTDSTSDMLVLPNEEWILFNDFIITPCSLSEVRELYDGQKVPVLLFFEKVGVFPAGSGERERQGEEPLASPVPVLSQAAFLELCHDNSTSQGPAQSFLPLGQDELPLSKGHLFALDAEFVAYSPPETLVRRGSEVETRPSRLGLGRISVVRGEGPLAGKPCIDDYIRSVEPVYDYLTRFSGLRPGDLDPLTSNHHLTTLRQAYLKLEYLVEAGAVFIGHGLKQDFRMLNIVVPSAQIIDTVDLYHLGHGRRLSLRFLAAYVLKTTIQEGIHDSIEDASVALKLYQEYKRMESDGIIKDVIAGMYEWGAVHGWDPTKWEAVPSC